MSRLPTLNLEELELFAISEALQRCGGDRASAARLLGVSRSTLYRKLKTHQGTLDRKAPRD
jgi:transcriptional regulator of acetoin/glycerol metabolism